MEQYSFHAREATPLLAVMVNDIPVKYRNDLK